jgi:hypothetical protein
MHLISCEKLLPVIPVGQSINQEAVQLARKLRLEPVDLHSELGLAIVPFLFRGRCRRNGSTA